jgi:UDP-N-acetyl-D-glucosamine dehydrogenase
MKIAVVAMGKIGLPLAVQFAEKGHDVIGVDVQQRVVDEINKGNLAHGDDGNFHS